MEQHHEGATGDVAEDHHADPERDGDDSATERNEGQCDEEDRDDEERIVEAGDVNRNRAERSLNHRDDELTSYRTANHGAHLGQIQVGDLDAEGVESANQHQYFSPVGQQGNQHIEENDGRRDEADSASGGPLKRAQQPFADVLGGGDHRRAQRVGCDGGSFEGEFAQQPIHQFDTTVAECVEIGGFCPIRKSDQHPGNLERGDGDEQAQRDDDGG